MSKPLSGCRVLDLGIITAGAATSAILSDLGAEVIKIESPTYRDPFRVWRASDVGGGKDAGNLLFFRSNNRNKAGISLDLKHPEGREAFLRLVAESDVVVENFRRGVMERLGLGAQSLREINPDIIVLAVSGQGSTGIDAAQTSFGTTLEAVAGLAWVTGYAGDAPVVTGRDLNYPDQIVAMFGASMVLAAWLERCRGQGGALLDVSQRELTSFMLGEILLASAAEQLPRNGNADPQYAIQDCYLAGDGKWLALSVLPEHLPTLSRCLGIAADSSLSALVQSLEVWAKAGHAAARTAILTAAGIAAAPVLDGSEVLERLGSLHSGAFIAAQDGSILKGLPFRIDSEPLAVLSDAPAIGRDTREVLEGIAGYSPAEVSALFARGVVELASEDSPAVPMGETAAS